MLAHWHTRSVLLALLVLAYSSAAAVSAEDTNDSSGPPTYRSTVSEVRVTFFATDENNHPLETADEIGLCGRRQRMSGAQFPQLHAFR